MIAREIMQTRFHTLSPHDTIKDGASLLSAWAGILDDKGVKYSMHYAYVHENFRLTQWRQDMDRRLNINYSNN